MRFIVTEVEGLDNVDALMVPVTRFSVTAAQGVPGVGVPTGGTTGQVLAKASDDPFDTEWVDQTGGGGSGGNLDGGEADSNYGGITGIDGGNA
jgi:hypothetical protein